MVFSSKMVLLLLTTSPYKMSLHTLLSSFLFFLMFTNSILSQKNKLDGLVK